MHHLHHLLGKYGRPAPAPAAPRKRGAPGTAAAGAPPPPGKRERLTHNLALKSGFDMYASLPTQHLSKDALNAIVAVRADNLLLARRWQRSPRRLELAPLAVEDDRAGHFAMALLMQAAEPALRAAWQRAEAAHLQYWLHDLTFAHLARLGARLGVARPDRGDHKACCWVRFDCAPQLLAAAPGCGVREADDLDLADRAELLRRRVPGADPGMSTAHLRRRAQLQRLLQQRAAQHRAWLSRRAHRAGAAGAASGASGSSSLHTALRVLTEEARLVERGWVWVACAHHLRLALAQRLAALLRRRGEEASGHLTSDPADPVRGWGLRHWWCPLCDRDLVGAARCPGCGGSATRLLLRKLHRDALSRRRGLRWGAGGQLLLPAPGSAPGWGLGRALGPRWRERLAAVGFSARGPCAVHHPLFHPGYQDGDIRAPRERGVDRSRFDACVRGLDGWLADPAPLWLLWERHTRTALTALQGAGARNDTMVQLQDMVARRGGTDNVVHAINGTYYCSKKGGGPGRYCPMKRGHHSSSNRGVLRLSVSRDDPRLVEVHYSCFSAGCRGRMLLGKIRTGAPAAPAAAGAAPPPPRRLSASGR